MNGHTSLDEVFREYGPFLSVSDAAELLGVTRPGLYHWIRDGVIPAYKIASTWLIPRDDLKRVIIAGSNQSATSSPVEEDPPP